MAVCARQPSAKMAHSKVKPWLCCRMSTKIGTMGSLNKILCRESSCASVRMTLAVLSRSSSTSIVAMILMTLSAPALMAALLVLAQASRLHTEVPTLMRVREEEHLTMLNKLCSTALRCTSSSLRSSLSVSRWKPLEQMCWMGGWSIAERVAKMRTAPDALMALMLSSVVRLSSALAAVSLVK